MKYINKRVFSLLSSGFVLLSICGCSKDIDSKPEVSCVNYGSDVVSTTSTSSVFTTNSLASTNTTTVESFTMSTSDVLTTSYVFTDFTDSTTYTTSSSILSSDNTSDFVVLDYFKNLGSSIKDNFDSSDLLDKGKSYFIYCVDFLFYDGEIKGIKFSDLTDSAKQQLLTDVSTIDSLICSKFPNYKESIKEGYGNAYNRAAEIIRNGSQNIKEFSKEKLGEENYNKIKEYKDMFIDTAFGDFDEFVDIVDRGKQKVKDWYEGLK